MAVIALVLNAVVSNRNERERKARPRRWPPSACGSKRLQAPHRGSATQLAPRAGASDLDRLNAREALVRAAEASITHDAQARDRRGELQGPHLADRVRPAAEGQGRGPRRPHPQQGDRPLRLCRRQGTVTGDAGQSVGRLGFPFVAALDFKKFTYVWCRNTPGQGERGVALAFVRLDRACLAAKGRALGTGYVDVPGS